MNRLMPLRTLGLGALFLWITLAVLAPNPFGNSPDIIGDESYFLTSALSALENVTPPGWDFTPGGNYYGGFQTYIDTAVLAPVVAGMLALNHFSLLETKVQVALHTGDLLALLRFVNSLTVVLFCGFLLFYFSKRKVPKELALQLLLLLFLLLGNSLVAGFVHTAKVWTLYLLLDVGIGALVVANQYYLTHRKESFVAPRTYTMFIIWAGILAFFQNYVGAFPIFLWLCYALVLKHISIKDVWGYVRRYWYLLLGFSLLQISFPWRAIFIKNHTGWWDPGQVSVVTAQETIDWFHRLYNPLLFTLQSQPLVLLYVMGLIAVLVLLMRHSLPAEWERRLFLLIACIHPLLIYVIFHVGFGFSLFPRYSLPLTIAITFAIVMLASESQRLLRVGLILSGLLFLMVTFHAITLYWQPASEVVLTRTLTQELNSPENVFLVAPDAWRLNLPLSSESLTHINARRQSMARYQFLLQNLDRVDAQVGFTPLVLIADTPEEEEVNLATVATSTKNVWTITTSCASPCTLSETAAGTCVMYNLNSCGDTPQEIHTLTDFLSFTQLGNSYVVRRLR